MLHILRFSLQNAVYFIMIPFFGSRIIHILHTGCGKIQMSNSGAKRLTGLYWRIKALSDVSWLSGVSRETQAVNSAAAAKLLMSLICAWSSSTSYSLARI